MANKGRIQAQGVGHKTIDHKRKSGPKRATGVKVEATGKAH